LLRKIATFDVMDGNGSSVAEIVDVSRNGRQLVYTDADSGAIGFVGISDPEHPVGQGTVEYESAEMLEHWLVSAGHYNEGRSENKGCEPEAVEVGVFRSPCAHGCWWQPRKARNLLFVGSERCNAVGVYDVSDGTAVPLQLLPTGIGPEGLKAIPRRNLFVASTEKDEAEAGIPTIINLYRLECGPEDYPTGPLP
jgi:hypothetical protein